MAEFQCLLHPLPGTHEQFIERLCEASEKINKGNNENRKVLGGLKAEVKEVVIGPSHIGVLLEDGRAFRVSFFINFDQMDLRYNDSNKSPFNNSDGPKSDANISTRLISRSRSKLLKSSTRSNAQVSRNSGAGIAGSSNRPLVAVPVPFVPDDLVSQAEAVLQGKSKNLIIRELQRTNLDVNLAVNNLLSHDDDEAEDVQSGEHYAPDDLISLLDNGFQTDSSNVIVDPADGLFSEEIFSNYSSIRNLLFNRIRSDRNQCNVTSNAKKNNSSASLENASSTGNNCGAPSLSGNADSFSRWRERHCYGQRRLFPNDGTVFEKEDDAKSTTSTANVSPLWISEELQAWPEIDVPIRFQKIVSLFSEFVGLSDHGYLHQWRWSENETFKSDIPNIFHPKTLQLNINEKITKISSSSTRCTVATITNHIASWMDEHLGKHAMKFSHSLQPLTDSITDNIESLHVSALFTVAITASQNLFWWGVLPFEQRKSLWDRFRSKTKKNIKLVHDEITVGGQVMMKKCPIYQSGSIGFTCKHGIPKIGQLIDSAWEFSGVYRFKILAHSSQDPNLLLNSKIKTQNIKESTDRQDMPPPPSPALNACGDSSTVPNKKTKRVIQKEHPEGQKDEELWSLKDVVFVEDRNGPIGKVLKVDGDYAAIRFASHGQNIERNGDDWQHCRLLKKEEVQIVKSLVSSKVPEYYQKTPKRLNVVNSSDANFIQFLAVAVDAKGVHTISKMSRNILYNIFSLHNSKQEQSSVLPTDYNVFLGDSQDNIAIHLSDDFNENCTIMIRDGNRTLYPYARDCNGDLKDPQWLSLPPISTMAMSTVSLPVHGVDLKSKVCMVVMFLEKQYFMPSILRCDLNSIVTLLGNLDNESLLTSVVNEKCDGGRNILHASVVLCSPISKINNDEPTTSQAFKKDLPCSSTDSVTSGESFATNLRDMTNRSVNTHSDVRNHITTSTKGEKQVPYELMQSEDESINPESSSKQSYFNKSNPTSIFISDPVERREQSILILQQICCNSFLRPKLHSLLSLQDATGLTPFMLSVTSRAYEAGLILFDTILSLSEDNPSIKESMVFPAGSSVDKSPLYVICYNDTCSFTWTGADHINQNIFECRTCGLTGSLCCCTECARVCHKGHDCKLKRTSPTAYCDCWEKCKCKALIAGNQNKRFSLLCKLISNTNLVTKLNVKGESILLFLIQTIGRQSVEQKQYRACNRSRSYSANNKKTQSLDNDPEMPDHDLEPPRFAKKALQRFLEDWQSVKVMIMTGTEERLQNEKIKNCGDMDSSSLKYLKSQSGSTLLDKFTHNLFVKCSQEHLDVLISTLVRETSETSNSVEKSIARRFIRSVARVYIIFNLERSPTENRKNAQSKHIQNCIAVFQALPILAIEELCEIAVALIGPVRLGVVRPTAPFAMSSSNLDNSEDIFSIDPFVFAARTASQTRSLPVDATNVSSGNIDLGLSFGVLRPENNNFEANMGPSGIVTSRQGSKCRLQPYSENMRSDDGGENESENEFNFNDAETESDSDDEQSSQGAQGIVPSATIVESETEESGDSSTHEDEGSDDGDTDENSEDSYSLNDSQLERNSADISKGTPSASSHWAIRNSEQAAGSSMRLPTSSGLVFIDPLALRRTAITSSASNNLQEPHSMSTTASSLARAFGIIMRQITDLLSSIEFKNVYTEKNMKVTLAEYIEVQMFLEIRLKETWNWVFSVLDATEAQLKFGACLTNPLDQSQAFRNINSNPQTVNDEHFGINFLGSTSSRREFFTYCLSLMRAHSSEHRDSLPVLDITALRHIAYALDGFIYYMKSEKCSEIKTEEYQVLEIDTNRKTKKSSPNDECTTVLNNSDKKQNFFRRSESTLSLGCCAPDPFSLTLEMALPLADKPQLLQTNARKEDLFLNFPLPITFSNNDPESVQELETPPLRVDIAHQNKPKDILENVIHTNKSKPVSPQKSFLQESSTSFKTENSFYSVPTEKKGSIDQQKRNISRSSTDLSVSLKFNQIEASSQNSVLKPNNLESKPSLGIFNRSENINHFPKSKGNQNTRIKKLTQCLGADSTTPTTWNVLLGRWKHSLDLFGRVFIEDVGLEYGSILSETRGFTAKETRFRRQMEKLRNGQQRDLVFSKLERSRDGLIVQTFRELNTQFGAQYRRNCPPLTFNRVKVTFKEEPGEGSGVARSFYTSIAEALLAKEKLPDLETAQIESPQKYGLPLPSSLKNRSVISRDATLQRKGPGKIVWRSNKEKKGCNHSATALLNTIQDSNNSETSNNGQLSIPLQQLGDCMYPKISAITNTHTSKISGTFLDTPPTRLSSEDTLKQKINEALDIILDKQNTTETRNNITSVDRLADNDPLFYSPGKRGFYSPRQGRASFERINAFRNIGRLIGICLLQNELFPLYLQRHVLKYILGKQIRFHDLAFFDPTVYESLRQLIQASKSDGVDVLDGLDLFFVIDLIKEEGGETVELVPKGRTVQVTTANILDYVRLYAEQRMVISQVKALEALKYGVFDVIPECSLESLTSEDLRLLLNGTGDINISILISYTTFNDESSESNDKLLRFKKWFWYTVEKMNTTERQDLLYFWTGSPALPASEEGFQPLPSITIRPIDDQHLPTANTCISRLYIPLYSSKTILRSKILLAIRSKNFGFV